MRALIAGLMLAFAAGNALAVETPPAGGPARDFTLPAKHVIKLDNGLSAIFVQYGTVPKVLVNVRVAAGEVDEGGRTWLSDLLGEMLKEGTTRRDAAQVARDAAGMGGDVSVSAGEDATSASIDVLSDFAAPAVSLLAEIVTSPALPASQFERVRGNAQRALSVSRAQAQSQAAEAFLGMLYPDQAYGRVFPTDAQLAGYTLQEVKDFYAAQFGARRTLVTVVGRFDEAAVEKALRDAFGAWAPGPAPAELHVKTSAGRQVKVIDRPGAPQSTLYLGLPVPGPANDDFVRLSTTQVLLGGFFSSRITANIREDKGYTYSPRSRLTSYVGASHWVETADVTTEHTGAALHEIFREIERLRKEAPPDAELARVKSYLTGNFILQNASRGGITSQLLFLAAHDLPDSYLTGFVSSVQAITPDQVRDMADKYLRPADMTLAVVGDVSKIRSQLDGLAELKP